MKTVTWLMLVLALGLTAACGEGPHQTLRVTVFPKEGRYQIADSRGIGLYDTGDQNFAFLDPGTYTLIPQELPQHDSPEPAPFTIEGQEGFRDVTLRWSKWEGTVEVIQTPAGGTYALSNNLGYYKLLNTDFISPPFSVAAYKVTPQAGPSGYPRLVSVRDANGNPLAPPYEQKLERKGEKITYHIDWGA